MFDARARKHIDPALEPIGQWIADKNISANLVTLASLIPAALAVFALSQQEYLWAIFFITVNRFLDGLDGVVARINGSTPLGGYLDILCDFAFYVGIPIGFGLASPDNQMAAILLVAAFTVTGISFLAFASIAAKHNIKEGEFGEKAFLYTTGVMEGGETITFFIAFCFFPAWFTTLASIFAALCLLTVLQRSFLAYRTFK